jgi:hypothetical protein
MPLQEFTRSNPVGPYEAFYVAELDLTMRLDPRNILHVELRWKDRVISEAELDGASGTS